MRCECSIDVDYTKKAPQLVSCANEAAHYFGGSVTQAAVCSDCLERLKVKYPLAKHEPI